MKTPFTSSIKICMAAKDISLRDLAEKTGLSYGYVSNLISGSKKSEKGLSDIIGELGMAHVFSTVSEAAAAQTVDQEAGQ